MVRHAKRNPGENSSTTHDVCKVGLSYTEGIHDWKRRHMETLTAQDQTVPTPSSNEDSGEIRKMIAAPVLEESEGICVRSVDCRNRFEYGIQMLKKLSPSEAQNHGFDRDPSLFTMQDTFAHFKAWGNSIAAFQNVVRRSSLEFRLKEASEIQQRVLKILGNLQVSLYEAALIFIGEEKNESWPIEEFSDSENEGVGIEFEQTSELQELFRAMKDANTNLMKLSMVIRNSPDRDDYLKAATRYPFDASYDIGHVREKHGSAKGIADWLVVRLGKAITRRRQYLKYRQDHHGKLTRDWGETAVIDENKKTIASTEATDFIENTIPVQKDESELGSYFGSQTSYEATIVGEAAGRLKVPSHPKMAFEDVPFEFGSPFRCPYCFTEQIVENGSDWKKHVFRDLRPYVCTFEECDMRMFRSRNEWFAHELQHHRREWACQQCQHTPFSTSLAYKTHLMSKHHIEVEGSQLKGLMLQSEEPVEKISATACQLCDEWKTNIEDIKHDYKRYFFNGGQPSQPCGTRGQFRRHLGRHMEQLALFALPTDEDIMEDESLSEEEYHEEASVSNANREDINNEALKESISEDFSLNISDLWKQHNTMTRGANPLNVTCPDITTSKEQHSSGLATKKKVELNRVQSFLKILIPIRESVAPLNDAEDNHIPPETCWNKIDERLVSPDTLETGKEQSEIEEDFAIVVRVLSREETQAYAVETQKIRGGQETDRAATRSTDIDSSCHRDRRSDYRDAHQRHKRETEMYPRRELDTSQDETNLACLPGDRTLIATRNEEMEWVLYKRPIFRERHLMLAEGFMID
ncbi:hypothetical protein SBOR_4315 [Sclerotinia borealis F-4128]|uniref:C2H2-type domain-containing protein n=1 Tax=Sclerotinia borealis (strain F-4128) TaxID=1432307 RepID=W9CH77_SCLBF|nr:hypothetical protein SBOR_4315 [Sclerotinia borealis F-4128]